MIVITMPTYPQKLYRYGEAKWLSRALKFGEFRLRPAVDYGQETTPARRDDELRKVVPRPDGSVKIFTEDGSEISGVTNFKYIKKIRTDYYLLCLSSRFSGDLFKEFEPADSCLVIDNPLEFSERFHLAVEKQLPGWSGFDAPITYDGFSDFDATFTKSPNFRHQEEWRFSFMPPVKQLKLEPVNVTIGNIEDIAHLVSRMQT